MLRKMFRMITILNQMYQRYKIEFTETPMFGRGFPNQPPKPRNGRIK